MRGTGIYRVEFNFLSYYTHILYEIVLNNKLESFAPIACMLRRKNFSNLTLLCRSGLRLWGLKENDKRPS